LSFAFVITGPPRTKKNHTRRIKRGGRIYTIQSEAHEAWASSAWAQLVQQKNTLYRPINFAQLTGKWNLAALIYRERDTGDLGNYLAAICDILQKARVIPNDKMITRFDGSDLLVDPEHPRVEIVLRAL
jgi:Holliday junction resolvase RusA-like endonuclease